MASIDESTEHSFDIADDSAPEEGLTSYTDVSVQNLASITVGGEVYGICHVQLNEGCIISGEEDDLFRLRCASLEKLDRNEEHLIVGRLLPFHESDNLKGRAEPNKSQCSTYEKEGKIMRNDESNKDSDRNRFVLNGSQKSSGVGHGSDSDAYSLDFEEEEIEEDGVDVEESKTDVEMFVPNIEEDGGNQIKICINTELPIFADNNRGHCFEVRAEAINHQVGLISTLENNSFKHDDIGDERRASDNRSEGGSDSLIESLPADQAIAESERIRQLVDYEVRKIVSEKFHLLSPSPYAKSVDDISVISKTNACASIIDTTMIPDRSVITAASLGQVSNSKGYIDKVEIGNGWEPCNFNDTESHSHRTESELKYQSNIRQGSFHSMTVPVNICPSTMPLPIGDVIARALSAVKKTRELSDGTKKKSEKKYPGRQKQFLDAETERVSRLMLRAMQPEGWII